MNAYFCNTCKEACQLTAALISPGNSVCAGGSATLKEAGIFSLLEKGDYDFHHHKDRMSPEENRRQALLAFSCDVFLSGVNAITENGEIYNVDGSGNRIAPISYGPKTVILVAGTNKITPSLSAAVLRVKKTAAPKNAIAKGHKTACAITGHCISLSDCPPDYTCDTMTAGCLGNQRICSSYLVLGHQHEKLKDRIHVILIDKSLGY